MKPVYLDCPVLIAPSIFSNVYSQDKSRIFCFNVFLASSNHIILMKRIIIIEVL